jgi:hypothetical protein
MNPEFERNLYLEFSVARLIGMPLSLMVIFAFAYLINSQEFGEDVATAAITLYVFIVLFWGSRQAAESIFDELRNRTWDIQKTSAISPWSLTWGKLFGSTLFNWYGGIICLLVYAIATPKAETLFSVVFYAIGGGLLAQSLCLLVSLFALRKKQGFNSSLSYLFVLFLLFFASGMITGIEHNPSEVIHWFYFETTLRNFGLTSLVLACGWTLTGIYRLLTQELQIRTLPWVWMLFIAFLIIYTQGLIIGHSYDTRHEHIIDHDLSNPSYLALSAFVICTVLTYSLIFIDDNNPMLLRRLWIYSQEEKWQRFLEEVPCWIISLVLAAPACLYLALSFPAETTDENLHFYPIPIFLLIIRDIGIILFFNYAPNPKRALSLSLLYLTFLYWVIPVIFVEAGTQMIAALFLPIFSDSLGLAVIFAAAQVGLIGYLVFQRWQNRLNQIQNDV